MPSKPPVHKPRGATTWDQRRKDDPVKRFRSTARWQKVRELKLDEDPLCEPCRAKGRVVPARQVHHKLDIRNHWDLRADMDNLESVCTKCHAAREREARE